MTLTKYALVRQRFNSKQQDIFGTLAGRPLFVVCVCVPGTPGQCPADFSNSLCGCFFSEKWVGCQCGQTRQSGSAGLNQMLTGFGLSALSLKTHDIQGSSPGTIALLIQGRSRTGPEPEAGTRRNRFAQNQKQNRNRQNRFPGNETGTGTVLSC